MSYREIVRIYQNIITEQNVSPIGIPLSEPTDRAAKKQLEKMIPKGEKVHTFGKLQKAHFEPEGEAIDEQSVPYGARTQGLIIPMMGKDIDGKPMKMYGAAPFPTIDFERKQRMKDLRLIKKQEKKTTQVAHFEPEGGLVENYYDEVFTILLDEGYSEKEANKLMVQFVTEGWWGDIVKAAKSRTSSLRNVLRAGATDLVATGLGASGGSAGAIKPPAKPAPIVRQVASKPPAQPPTIGQIAKNVASKISNAVQPRLVGSRTIANLAAGKPGGSLGNVVNTQVVKPRVKTNNLASANPSGSSSVSSRSSGSVSRSNPGVRTPGGSLEKAGPTVDVKSSSGPRVSQSVPRPRIPRVSSPTPAAASGSTASSLLGALKYVPHVAAAAIGLNAGPVADGTIDAAKKRGEYFPTPSGTKGPIGPKDPEAGLTRAQSFDKAFAKARKSGAKEFTWRSGKYTTKLKGES